MNEALESKHLAGAALDVFPGGFRSESASRTRLSKQSNVILTPEIGSKTIQAVERIGIEVAEVLSRYISDGIFSLAYFVRIYTISCEYAQRDRVGIKGGLETHH